MTKVRIYNPTKRPIQSGGNAESWVLEFIPGAHKRSIDPTMGWTSSKDMMQEVRMTFPSCDTAVAFAIKNGMSYEIVETLPHKIIKKSYSDNFV
jgi:hypothetical protein